MPHQHECTCIVGKVVCLVSFQKDIAKNKNKNRNRNQVLFCKDFISYHIETGDCSIYYPLAIGYFVGSKIVLLVY